MTARFDFLAVVICVVCHSPRDLLRVAVSVFVCCVWMLSVCLFVRCFMLRKVRLARCCCGQCLVTCLGCPRPRVRIGDLLQERGIGVGTTALILKDEAWKTVELDILSFLSQNGQSAKLLPDFTPCECFLHFSSCAADARTRGSESRSDACARAQQSWRRSSAMAAWMKGDLGVGRREWIRWRPGAASQTPRWTRAETLEKFTS